MSNKNIEYKPGELLEIVDDIENYKGLLVGHHEQEIGKIVEVKRFLSGSGGNRLEVSNENNYVFTFYPEEVRRIFDD